MSAATVRCELCFRYCNIPPGQRGNCRVRYNHDGELVSLVYGKPCAAHLDPIEKKPLFHFLPGSRAFSIATAGCNGHCRFCQNWDISQRTPEETENMDMPPADVVANAIKSDCRSIAYTYTDPNIFYEYTYDTSVLARKKGLKNVLVTAGFLNEKPLRELARYADAANLDVKGNDEFYKKYVLAELKPVMDYLRIAREEGIFLELTNLIVPTLNDKKEDIEWLIKTLLDAAGPDVPMHFSRFFPLYQLTNLYPTPTETLFDAAHMAEDLGMHYVYVGNLPAGEFENTRCPKCKETVIRRQGFSVIEIRLVDGHCPKCKEKIPGVWR